jgi:hypothetical protein
MGCHSLYGNLASTPVPDRHKHSCSPAIGFFATVIRVMRSIIANLTPASRRQDHTTSPSATSALVRSAFRVHRIPSRVRDDRDTPLMWDETAADKEMIWVGRKRKYFSLWDSTAPTTPNLARRARLFILEIQHCRQMSAWVASRTLRHFRAVPRSGHLENRVCLPSAKRGDVPAERSPVR